TPDNAARSAGASAIPATSWLIIDSTIAICRLRSPSTAGAFQRISYPVSRPALMAPAWTVCQNTWLDPFGITPTMLVGFLAQEVVNAAKLAAARMMLRIPIFIETTIYVATLCGEPVVGNRIQGVCVQPCELCGRAIGNQCTENGIGTARIRAD